VIHERLRGDGGDFGKTPQAAEISLEDSSWRWPDSVTKNEHHKQDGDAIKPLAIYPQNGVTLRMADANAKFDSLLSKIRGDRARF
jgi:hypothetical protein